MFKKLFFLGIIAMAICIPMALSQERGTDSGADASSGGGWGWGSPGSSWGDSIWGSFPDQPASNPIGSPASASGVPASQASWTGGGQGPIVQGHAPVYNAFTNPAQYLNFSIRPDHVRGRWQRVSMVSGEDQLTGMRVPLVSGPRPADVHGSLTYYFDRNQTLQRITLRGWTGHPAEIVSFATSVAGMAQRESPGAGFYLRTAWGKPQAFLRLDYPMALDQNAPTEQFMLLMELVNPESSLAVSQQNQQILNALRARQ